DMKGHLHNDITFPANTDEVRVAFAGDRRVGVVGAGGAVAGCGLQDGEGGGRGGGGGAGPGGCRPPPGGGGALGHAGRGGGGGGGPRGRFGCGRWRRSGGCATSRTAARER